MTAQAEIRARFWKALSKDRTIMLGLEDARAGDLQPMTALIEDKDEARRAALDLHRQGVRPGRRARRRRPRGRGLREQGPRPLRQPPRHADAGQ